MRRRDLIALVAFAVSILIVCFHREVYVVLAWAWGGNGNGGAESTGYLITSGPLPDLTMFGSIGYLADRARRHFQCHVQEPENCTRFGHLVPGTGYRACPEHHPDYHDGAITAAHIAGAHGRANDVQG